MNEQKDVPIVLLVVNVGRMVLVRCDPSLFGSTCKLHVPSLVSSSGHYIGPGLETFWESYANLMSAHPARYICSLFISKHDSNPRRFHYVDLVDVNLLVRIRFPTLFQYCRLWTVKAFNIFYTIQHNPSHHLSTS